MVPTKFYLITNVVEVKKSVLEYELLIRKSRAVLKMQSILTVNKNNDNEDLPAIIRILHICQKVTKQANLIKYCVCLGPV